MEILFSPWGLLALGVAVLLIEGVRDCRRRDPAYGNKICVDAKDGSR
jgi:hypothetical protein